MRKAVVNPQPIGFKAMAARDGRYWLPIQFWGVVNLLFFFSHEVEAEIAFRVPLEHGTKLLKKDRNAT